MDNSWEILPLLLEIFESEDHWTASLYHSWALAEVGGALNDDSNDYATEALACMAVASIASIASIASFAT